MTIHLAVEIETSQGIFKRTNSTPYNVNVAGTVWSPSSGVILYPDRRAKTMKVFAEDGANYRLVKTFDLTPSKKDNYAFVLVDSVDLAVFESTELLPVDGYNDENEVIQNRVRLSETNQPFVFKADKTYSIGQSSNEEVTGFAVNTLDVSSGQYGQYPLYVLCRHSIWALEQSEDPLIAFQRLTPVSLSHGVKDSTQVTNIGRSIALIYNDGLFLLAGSDTPEIGRAIADYPNKETIDFDSAILSSRRRGADDEILLSDGSTTYVYNLTYQRWYAITRNRAQWFMANGKTYGVDDAGNIYDESDYQAGGVAFTVKYDPIHLGSPEMLKRLFAVYMRGKKTQNTLWTLTIKDDKGNTVSVDDVENRVKLQSSYDFEVWINGIMNSDDEYLEGVSVQMEGRYPHRNKVMEILP